MKNIDEVQSPFGGKSHHVQTLSTGYICELYRRKCGIDVIEFFHGLENIDLFECSITGYRFWRPAEIAGSEQFYKLISHCWPEYYRTNRWEYKLAKSVLKNGDRLLEVGCGRGFFLKSLEGKLSYAVGLELNRKAIENSVTSFPMRAAYIEDMSLGNEAGFDVICAFQVLEHVPEPSKLLSAAASLLSPGGRLLVSVPNREYPSFMLQYDAFDLPPHHIGHFNLETFKGICRVSDFSLEAFFFQPREPDGDVDVSVENRRRYQIRAARFFSRKLYRWAFKSVGELGPNLLVVLRKG